ncbi:MAG TPA: Rieske 2Fe-2S domain-containing protein, partial [Terriglobales bacterium]|nr:Rieske 2Fe-2S domain-containing protein [Terriglobales bacterium]
MNHATQVALTRRILSFLDSGTTELAARPFVNEVSTYTCAEQLQRERTLLFRQQPLFVGLSQDVGSPGSYLVHDDSAVPILLVRRSSGELDAFLDVCRHRGARVVAGSGAGTESGRRRFSCPYHGWTYDESGAL